MARLLYIESSPRKERSKSIIVAKSFIKRYKAEHPSDEVLTLNLWEMKLPESDSYTIEAKYQVIHGHSLDEMQKAALQAVVDVCEEFKSADKYLFSVPMWNFGVPYKLKHYIDVLVQPGQTFSFEPSTGYCGLVTGKPAAVIYSRGGSYSSDTAKLMDLQKGYMDLLLGFIGFKDLKSIVFEPTLGAPADVAKTEAAAIAEAEKIAATF